MRNASQPFVDGFFGSFRVAAIIVRVAVSMVAAFFHARPHAALNVVRKAVQP